MSRYLLMFIAILATTGMGYEKSQAQDMRSDHVVQREKLDQMKSKASQELKDATQEARENFQKLTHDKTALLDAIKQLEIQNKQLNQDIDRHELEYKSLKDQKTKLSDELAQLDAMIRELSGYIRINAQELDTLIAQSPQSALDPNRQDTLKPILENISVPSMDHIQQMADLILSEIYKSGQVKTTKGTIVDRTGKEVEADLLILGNFTAAYMLPDETGFLLYSDKSRRFFALSKLPGRRIANKLKAYAQGRSEDVYIDISKGGALRQMTHQMSLADQIEKGGPIVWPILAILMLAIVLVIERSVFLFRKKLNADAFMDRLNPLIVKQDRDQCRHLCNNLKYKPIPRVLLAGIEYWDKPREDMENALQEAILRQIPSLERFLSTLGILAAISPLLGLLGTVTGMINTFQVITYYGTGDPRMMSGGISEALVTTMLGLSVAIPIMLCHTLFSRKVENTIAQMEEKAVSFVNTVLTVRHDQLKQLK